MSAGWWVLIGVVAAYLMIVAALTAMCIINDRRDGLPLRHSLARVGRIIVRR